MEMDKVTLLDEMRKGTFPGCGHLGSGMGGEIIEHNN